MDKWRKLAILPLEIFAGDITGETEIETKGIKRDVLLINGDKILGAKIFTGEIVLNEKLLGEEAEKGRRNVLLHEEGHRQQKLLSHLTGISQIILSPPGLIVGATAALLQILTSFAAILPNPGLIIGLYLLSATISYLGELDAQFFLIDKIGEKEFLEGVEQNREINPRTPLRKLFLYPSHPPDWLTLKTYHLLKDQTKSE